MTEVGLAALSDEVRIIVPTPVARQASIDVLRPDDVGLGRLERVVLAGLDVLEGGAVEDDVDPLDRPVEPVAVADVADQEADVGRPSSRCRW